MAPTILKWSEEIGLYSFPWRNNNKRSQISKSKQRCDYTEKFESNINKYICITHCWLPITNIYGYFSPNYSILYGDTISQSNKADGKLPKTETASWNVLKFRITATLRYRQRDRKPAIIGCPSHNNPCSLEKQPAHALPSTDETWSCRVNSNTPRPRAPDSLLKWNPWPSLVSNVFLHF